MRIEYIKITSISDIGFGISKDGLTMYLKYRCNKGYICTTEVKYFKGRKLYKLIDVYCSIRDKYVVGLDRDKVVELLVDTDNLKVHSGKVLRREHTSVKLKSTDIDMYLNEILVYDSGIKIYNCMFRSNKNSKFTIDLLLHEDEFNLIGMLNNLINVSLINAGDGKYDIRAIKGYNSVKIKDMGVKGDNKDVFKDNINFYPTPIGLIDRLLNGDTGLNLRDYIVVNGSRILEPSAGSGNIVDYLCTNYNINKMYIDCIEKDERLREQLLGKGYNLVGNDYLSFREAVKYDIIIANPPYSNGSKHLLRMLRYIKCNGGILYCIIGSHILERKDNRDVEEIHNLIGLAHSVSIEEVENGFTNAERRTDIKVTLLRVRYIGNVDNILDLDMFKEGLRGAYINLGIDTSTCTAVSKGLSGIDGLILKYNIELECFKKFYRSYLDLKEIGRGLKAEFAVEYSNKELNLNYDYNTHLYNIRYIYWVILFNSNSLSLKFPYDVMCLLRENVKEFAMYDFSKDNINRLLSNIVRDMPSILDKMLEKLFDTLTWEYCYLGEQDLSKLYYTAWKTNKGYIIGNKAIVGNGMTSKNPLGMCEFGRTDDVLSNMNYKVLEDLLVCVQILEYNNITNIDYTAIRELMDTKLKDYVIKGLKECDFGEFSIKAYKKGTLHIIFKDKGFVDKFNLKIGRIKSWLPSSFGKVDRDKMGSEDRVIVESFNKAMNNFSKKEIDYNRVALADDSIARYGFLSRLQSLE